MDLSLGTIIASADESITRKLYLHTAIVAIFLLIVISITIWAGNTLTMITAIARFERTHTVSRVESIAALLKFHDNKKPEEMEKFQVKMAVTQSYNKVFSRLLDMRKDTPDSEFVRILENTFSETDHKTAVIIVNRVKVLYWHPILQKLVADAVGANAAGEQLKTLAAQFIAANNEVEQAAIFEEIENIEHTFLSYEASFSKNCSTLSNQISSYVNYITMLLLIISVGFTGLLTYLIARSVIQQAARYTSELEKEIQARKLKEEELLSLKDRLQQQNEELQVNEEELRCQNDELMSAEVMLRDSKEKYRLLVENLASGVVVHALDSSVVFANPAALTMLGLRKEQIKGKAAIDPYWCFLRENGSVMPHDEFPVSQVLSSGTPLYDFVVGVRRPDLFDPLWVLCHAYPSRDAEGRLQQVVVTFSDITSLKRADEALNKRLFALTQPLENATVSFNDLFDIDDVQRLQDEFAKATGVASIITDPEGVPLTAPSNFTRLCNDIIRKSEKGCANCFKSDAALGRFNPDGPTIQPCLSGGLWDAGAGITVGGQHIANWLIGQVRDESHTEEAAAAYAREINVDEALFLGAFREVPSMSRNQFEQIAGTLFTLANQLSTSAYQNIQQARFINERKQAEEQMTSMTERLQLATSSAHLGIWDWDARDNILLWDDRMLALFGITRDTFSNSVDAWMNGLHPEDKEAAIAEFQAALNGDKEFDTEFRVLHPDGTVKNLRGKGLVLRGADGNAERMIGINYDVTETKRAKEEKDKLESQLQQSQKMESVGRLAGGVAHDFNNMLGVILGHAEIGLMHLDPTHRVCADLKEIAKAAERSADLTRQLLAFARKQTVAPKVIDLNDTVTSMLKMLQRLIGEDIQLNWQPSPAQCLIKMDPSQIDQILANLCVNARDAIEDTGRITIKTDTCSIDAGYCASNPEAAPGDYVRLVVSDSGKGMDRETQTHIFEPFYTTKEIGKGTGLGLATVYGAVKQNNGFINIYSEPGKGTTFSIHLPRETNMGTACRASTDAETAVPCGQETILLVEDEAAILNITAIMLENQGYTVLRADSPGQALELAREHPGPIHLLMTDVIMPEMNGRDLAKNILGIHPGMKRLFMSGYTADVIAHHGMLDDDVHFIQKPFSLPNMAATVREVLDTPYQGPGTP